MGQQGGGCLAIVVGGGPAPGINSVISAATIRAKLAGVKVLGVHDGFTWLMAGKAGPEQIEELEISKISRVHFRGGSVIGTARANPTTDPGLLETTVRSLESLGVTQLITIGGDDTAYSAMKVWECAAGRIRVVHVPKTIDNDLPLPATIDTFGFQTARHVGVELIHNLMVDAFTTQRWYFVITMGRKAGHLALGIGKAAGATLTLIPEEFGEAPLRLRRLVDTLACAVIKRARDSRRDGVAVIAEGVMLNIDPQDLEELDEVGRDEHGHIRLAEIDLGDLLKRAVRRQLAELGIKTTIADKEIGYELRSADPIPFDMEYTRDLGYCAAKHLIEGGDGAMVTMQAGRFVPVPFAQMVDETGRARLRLVDINSTRYAIARRYMIRLRCDDFEDAEGLAGLARTCSMTVDEFRTRFAYLVEDEPGPLMLSEKRG